MTLSNFLATYGNPDACYPLQSWLLTLLQTLQGLLSEGIPGMYSGSGAADPTAPAFPELEALFTVSTDDAFVVWENTTTGTFTLYIKVNGVWQTSGIPLGSSSSSSGGTVPGLVLPYSGTAASAALLAPDWLLAAGQTVSSVTYPDLFAAIGNSWGGVAPDFVIPDMRGRVPSGADNFGDGSGSAGVLATMGLLPFTAGGTERHTLTATEIPAHRHPLYARAQAPDSSLPANKALAQANIYDTAPSEPDQQLREGTVGYSTGGGSAHNNMQPSRFMLYLIKT